MMVLPSTYLTHIDKARSIKSALTLGDLVSSGGRFANRMPLVNSSKVVFCEQFVIATDSPKVLAEIFTTY